MFQLLTYAISWRHQLSSSSFSLRASTLRSYSLLSAFHLAGLEQTRSHTHQSHLPASPYTEFSVYNSTQTTVYIRLDPSPALQSHKQVSPHVKTPASIFQVSDKLDNAPAHRFHLPVSPSMKVSSQVYRPQCISEHSGSKRLKTSNIFNNIPRTSNIVCGFMESCGNFPNSTVIIHSPTKNSCIIILTDFKQLFTRHVKASIRVSSSLYICPEKPAVLKSIINIFCWQNVLIILTHLSYVLQGTVISVKITSH